MNPTWVLVLAWNSQLWIMIHQQLFWRSRAWRWGAFYSRLWLLSTRDPRSRTTLEKSAFHPSHSTCSDVEKWSSRTTDWNLTLFFPLELEQYCSPNSSLIVYPTFSVATASWTSYHRSSSPSRTKASPSGHISSNIRQIVVTIRDLIGLLSSALAYSSRKDMTIIRRRWFPGACVARFDDQWSHYMDQEQSLPGALRPPCWSVSCFVVSWEPIPSLEWFFGASWRPLWRYFSVRMVLTTAVEHGGETQAWQRRTKTDSRFYDRTVHSLRDGGVW